MTKNPQFLIFFLQEESNPTEIFQKLGEIPLITKRDFTLDHGDVTITPTYNSSQRYVYHYLLF